MATLPETESFDAGIYKLETTDPVQGGDAGVSNDQAKGLANRTNWLKARVDEVIAQLLTIAGLDSPALTGTPTAPTAGAGDDDTSIATTAFVHRNSGGYASIDCAGNANITLTADQWGCAVIILTGLLTGNINVIFPTRGDRWLVDNRSTGLFTITCKTAAGTGVKVAQTRSKSVWSDGTNILDEETDLSQRAVKKVAAFTAAPGGEYIIDQSGGAFATTMPLNPSEGDKVTLKGNFKTSNHTVARNGQSFYNEEGVATAEDLVLNRNHVTAQIWFDGTAWQV